MSGDNTSGAYPWISKPGQNPNRRDWEPAPGLSGGPGSPGYTYNPATGRYELDPSKDTGGHGAGGGIPGLGGGSGAAPVTTPGSGFIPGSIAGSPGATTAITTGAAGATTGAAGGAGMNYGTLIQIAGTIGQYLNARKAAKGAAGLSAAEQALAAQHAQLMAALQPYVTAYYGRSLPLFDMAAQHATALASGDRAQIEPRVAAQQAAIGRQYGNMISASRELNPRSGAGATYNTDLGFRASDAKQGLENDQINGAYGTLAGLSADAVRGGASAAGVATNAGSSALNAYDSSGNHSAYGSVITGQSYADLTKSLMDLYKTGQQDYGWGKKH